MKQQVRFCTSSDGVRIAWSVTGAGAPLVMSASWLTHLEHQWDSLAWRPWLEHFSQSHALLRYDSRGCGLSDRAVDDVCFENWMRDFEAITDAANFDRFAILATCQGGPIAIEYAARHPERVSKLVIYGSYARGLAKRSNSPEQAKKARVLLDMLQLGWGIDSHAFLLLWASLFQQDGSQEHLQSWSEQMRLSTSAEMAARLLEITFNTDARKAVAQVRCPTLIINSDHDPMVPIEEGRILAGLIAGARFVQLNSKNHMLLPEEPAWNRLVTEVESFLAEPEIPCVDNSRARFADLTVRERGVLAAMASGLGNAEIAVRLDLSEKTVRNHVTRVFDKIGVRHRYQAIVLARDAGLANEPTRSLE
jgi:pimeloyl-ACP methyl ester carboxylesterase/DNA-binding CsgD family transcriptional regulator